VIAGRPNRPTQSVWARVLREEISDGIRSTPCSVPPVGSVRSSRPQDDTPIEGVVSTKPAEGTKEEPYRGPTGLKAGQVPPDSWADWATQFHWPPTTGRCSLTVPPVCARLDDMQAPPKGTSGHSGRSVRGQAMERRQTITVAATSPGRVCAPSPTSREGSGTDGRCREARGLSHTPPLVRHASAEQATKGGAQPRR
jgi:hypothetical protein